MKLPRLAGLTALLCSLLGCPPVNTEEDLGVSSQDLVTLKPHVTKLDAGKRLDVRVEATTAGFARVFGINSGGSLSPISPPVPVSTGVVTQLVVLETYESDEGVAPGGPAFVVATRDASVMSRLEAVLKRSNPVELLRLYGESVLTVDRKR